MTPVSTMTSRGLEVATLIGSAADHLHSAISSARRAFEFVGTQANAQHANAERSLESAIRDANEGFALLEGDPVLRNSLLASHGIDSVIQARLGIRQVAGEHYVKGVDSLRNSNARSTVTSLRKVAVDTAGLVLVP